jgi:hypothetical protein
VHCNILVASGFSLWPSRPETPALTPTFNETRMGWNIRAVAGVNFPINKRLVYNLNFGYWASSSTSDDITWITHDTMLMSTGLKFNFLK